MGRQAKSKEAQFFRFESVDVTSMRDVAKFCKEFSQAEEIRQNGLHYLVLCAGGLNFGWRRETAEGTYIPVLVQVSICVF